MDATTPSQQERTEMELVLHSGIFQRAPLLARFFRYICECYFEGQSAQIKEYSIALEALGRHAGFDPKKDSIVRVEAHRLRKRLNDYYKGPGATHPVHILIPQGQYIPQFVSVENAPDPQALSESAYAEPDFSTVQLLEAPIPPEADSRAGRWPSGKWAASLSAMLICIALALAGWRLSHARATLSSKSTDEKWTGEITQPVAPEFRMLAGYHGQPVTDRQGHTWNADAYYTGGRSTPVPPGHPVEGEPVPHFLKTQRSGVFHYDIPVRQGTYELHLYFAEIEYGNGNPLGGGEGSRVFPVLVNGVSRVNQLDPLAEAGAPNRLHERVFKDISPAADGDVHIQLGSPGGSALLDALEIVPSAPGRIRPIRIVTQESPITDADGRVWSADEYFSGGTLVLRRNSIFTSGQSALYEGERYGNFSYRIPLAPGKYRVDLHFAETWFGTPESKLPAAGSRLFNVFANGVVLLRNFEICKEAGGVNRSLSKAFEDLEPNAQGILLLEFVPLKNYAEVNAIEVVETE